MAISVEEAKDLFGIPYGKDVKEPVSDSDVYEGVLDDGSLSFEDKVKNVTEAIQRKVDINSVITLETSSSQEDNSSDSVRQTEREESNIEEVLSPAVNEVENSSKSLVEEIDDILNDSGEDDMESSNEDQGVNKEQPEEVINEEDVEEETEELESETEEYQKVSSSLDNWNLESPNEKFNYFYKEKAKILKSILPKGKKLPIYKYEEDLINATVDVTTPIYDGDAIMHKMHKVQLWKDRVKEIQININSHYYLWERSLELLEGILSNVQYLKPAIKQNGLIYEHLGDMQLYFVTIKSLHRSAEIVSKNLDSAYNTLSRQLTIALPQKAIDTYNNNINNRSNQQSINSTSNSDLEGYDELDGDFEFTEDTDEDQNIDLESAAKETGWDEI